MSATRVADVLAAQVPQLLAARSLREEIKPLQLLTAVIADAAKKGQRVPLEAPADADAAADAAAAAALGDDSGAKLHKQMKQFVLFLFDRRFGWSESNNSGSSPPGSHTSIQKFKLAINACANMIFAKLPAIIQNEIWLDSVAYSVAESPNKPVVRQQAFSHFFDWLKQHKGTCTPSEFQRVQKLLLMGLTDVWSATRKRCGLRLYGVMDVFDIQQVRSVFEELSKVAAADNDAHSWKAKEGALLGVTVIIKRFRRLQQVKSDNDRISGIPDNLPGQSVKSLSPKLTKQQERLPVFVHESIRPITYPLLHHPQLSVRENATRAFAAFLSRSETKELLIAFREVVEMLRVPIDSPDGDAPPATPPEGRKSPVSPAAEAPARMRANNTPPRASGWSPGDSPSRRRSKVQRTRSLVMPSNGAAAAAWNKVRGIVLRARNEADDESGRSDLLPDASAEGVLGLAVILAKMAPVDFIKQPERWARIFSTFESYLSHPASTVRQTSSAIFQHLVAKATEDVELLPMVLRGLVTAWGDDKNWMWKEGRMLAYELIVQYLVENHRHHLDPSSFAQLTAPPSSILRPPPSPPAGPQVTPKAGAGASAGRQELSPEEVRLPGAAVGAGTPLSAIGLGARRAMEGEKWPRPSPSPSRAPCMYSGFKKSSGKPAAGILPKSLLDQMRLASLGRSPRRGPKMRSPTSAMQRQASRERMLGKELGDEFAKLLRQMIVHTRECLGSLSFELRRIVTQVLPALTRTICWFDLSICTELWAQIPVYLQKDDMLTCRVAALTMLAALEQAHSLKLQENELDNASLTPKTKALARAAVGHLLQGIRAQLPTLLRAVSRLAGDERESGWLAATSARVIVLLHVMFRDKHSISLQARRAQHTLLLKRMGQVCEQRLASSPIKGSPQRSGRGSPQGRGRSARRDAQQRERSMVKALTPLLPELMRQLYPTHQLALLPSLLRWLHEHDEAKSRNALLESCQCALILPLKLAPEYAVGGVHHNAPTTAQPLPPPPPADEAATAQAAAAAAAALPPTPPPAEKPSPKLNRLRTLQVDTQAGPAMEMAMAQQQVEAEEEQRVEQSVVDAARKGTLLRRCEQVVKSMCVLVKCESTEATVLRQALSMLQSTCVIVPDLRFAPEIMRAVVDRLVESGHTFTGMARSADAAAEGDASAQHEQRAQQLQLKSTGVQFGAVQKAVGSASSEEEDEKEDEDDESDDWDDWDEGGDDEDAEGLVADMVQFVTSVATEFPRYNHNRAPNGHFTPLDLPPAVPLAAGAAKDSPTLLEVWGTRKGPAAVSLDAVIKQMPQTYSTALQWLVAQG